MDENSTPEQRGRATNAAARIAQIGIPKQELAQRAGIDRGTLGRALKADPRITDRTWVRIERVLGQLEEEIGLTAPSTMLATETTASGESVVQSVVEYHGARITLSGRADAVAEAIRRVLNEGRSGTDPSPLGGGVGETPIAYLLVRPVTVGGRP